VKLSKAYWVMKCDAHCSFDQGFDRKMIEFMDKHGDDVTSVPIMRNLWPSTGNAGSAVRNGIRAYSY